MSLHIKDFFSYHILANEDFIQAKNRGVKFRYIFYTSTLKPSSKGPDDFNKTSYFNVRYISDPNLKALIAIYDNQKVHIVTSTDGNFRNSSMLWSKNIPFVSIIKNYFELLWIQAIERPFDNAKGKGIPNLST